MEDIRRYILVKYGFELSENEINELIKWYKENVDQFVDEEVTDVKIKEYLHTKYTGRPLFLFESDHSNMTYLLSLLKKQCSHN